MEHGDVETVLERLGVELVQVIAQLSRADFSRVVLAISDAAPHGLEFISDVRARVDGLQDAASVSQSVSQSVGRSVVSSHYGIGSIASSSRSGGGGGGGGGGWGGGGGCPHPPPRLEVARASGIAACFAYLLRLHRFFNRCFLRDCKHRLLVHVEPNEPAHVKDLLHWVPPQVLVEEELDIKPVGLHDVRERIPKPNPRCRVFTPLPLVNQAVELRFAHLPVVVVHDRHRDRDRVAKGHGYRQLGALVEKRSQLGRTVETGWAPGR